MTQPNEEGREAPSVLQTLRGVVPARRLHLFEALRIAELQANRLLELRGTADDVPVAETAITELPRVVVEYEADMPCSGASTWDTDRRAWVITLNALEPETRQRFSLMHEYKHIIDHNAPGLVSRGQRTYYGQPPVEYVADYFAGCVLMPKRLIRRAWADGVQRTTDLAELFDVSARAVEVRLSQLGLGDAARYRRSLCSGRVPYVSVFRSRRTYRRAFSPHRPAELELTR